jgi:uncharacterized membrane protein YccC
MGLFLIPVGFAVARSRTPALMPVFGGMGVAVMRILSPTNPMVYDTAQFYNTALAIFVGCGVGPLALSTTGRVREPGEAPPFCAWL